MMVTKCKVKDDGANGKCQNGNSLSYDASLNTPVYYHNVLYKNYHCLACNENWINKSELISATPNYQCLNKTFQLRAIEIYSNKRSALILYAKSN